MDNPESLGVQVVTWNVNSKPPPSDLTDLIGIARKPDLVAIGLQEEHVSTREPYVGDIPRLWEEALDGTMARQEYIKVGNNSMVGISLKVYARSKLVRPVLTEKWELDTRLGQNLGHKGGVYLGFNVSGANLGFITSHLTHSEAHLEKRMEDFKLLEERKPSDQEDYRFWMGDLNFRLMDKDNLTAQVIQDELDKGRMEELLKKDELSTLKAEGKVFQGYSEMPIRFKPTYKYKIGTSEYELTRRPAWTDRVLYRAAMGRKISPENYNSISQHTNSDHKPVEAFFKITV